MRLGLGAFGLPISISVREPLPANAFYDLGEAGHVIHAELATVRVAEIEFDAVAVQVLARGVYQHCSEKHLHRYLAEFEYRFNNRVALGVDDEQRAETVIAQVVGKRLTYKAADRPA